MMWNALVSALLVRSSIVMLDGDPAWPDLLEQWRLAEELRPSVMGVVNVTPDSFSDGGRFMAPERALAQARRMAVMT